MYLAANPAPTSLIPPQFVWFTEGWNDFKFVVDEDGFVCAESQRPYWGKQNEVMWLQAGLMCDTINHTFDDLGGIFDAIEYGLAVGWLIWNGE